MQYTIKGQEGIENFLKTYSAMMPERNMDRSFFDLFDKETIIKEGFLKEGDQILAQIEEHTSITRKKITTDESFIVERHDSFLLKLVKSKP